LRVQRLLGQLLPFHHREMKVPLWAYSDRLQQALQAPAELEDDGEAIAEALCQSLESLFNAEGEKPDQKASIPALEALRVQQSVSQDLHVRDFLIPHSAAHPDLSDLTIPSEAFPVQALAPATPCHRSRPGGALRHRGGR
jgi:hypothetical protein